MLGLHESSLRLSAEVSPADLKAPPTPDQPRMMRVRVTGQSVLTGADILFVLLSWLDMLAAFLFVLFSLVLAAAPSPYVYFAPLPVATLYLNGRTAFRSLKAEFQINANLREVLGRKAGESVLLMVISLLGPESTILLDGISLHPLGVSLSNECLTTLRTHASYIAPLTLDLPLLVINYLYHARTEGLYDVPAMLSLSLCTLSLVVHWPWRIARLFRAQRRKQAARDAQDESLSVGEGASFEWPLPPSEIGSRRRVAHEPAQRPPSPERLRMHEDMKRQLAMSQVLLAASLMIP